MTLPRRWFAIAIMVTLIVSSCSEGGIRVSNIVGYEVDSSGRKLTVVVIAGQGADVSGSIVSESDDVVVVRLEAEEQKGINVAMGIRYPIQLTLAQPLGSRTIHTTDGYVVPTVPPAPSP